MVPRPFLRRLLSASLLAAAMFVSPAAQAEPSHAIAMLGDPKYPAGFTHFDYVNPDAPQGGELRLHALGSFDTLNPYIVRGKAAAGVHHGAGMYFETLAKRSRDEPFTLYGLLAETIEMPPDRAWAEFTLRAEAKFSDGSPVTVEDVIFSWETLKARGLPNARATWSRASAVSETGPCRVRFTFENNEDRELPLLVAGFMPILSKAYWKPAPSMPPHWSRRSPAGPISSNPSIRAAQSPIGAIRTTGGTISR